MKLIQSYFDAWHLALLVILATRATAGGVEVSGRQSGRWTFAASPYIVTGNVIIPEQATLTIEPGVIVKFTGYYSIKIDGTFRALGSPINRIVFTSGLDSEYADEDFSLTNPATSNDWVGIEFTDSSNDEQSRMENCIIKYCTMPLVMTRAWPRRLEGITISQCGRHFVKINGVPIPFKDGVEQDYHVAGNINVAPATFVATPPETSATPVLSAALPSESPPAPDTPKMPTIELGTIYGRVTDIETGARVSSANLEVVTLGDESAATGTTSRLTGEFEIKNLTPGIYTMTASCRGYAQKVLPALVVNAGEETTLEVALAHIGSAFNPTIISASRHPEKIFDAPAAIVVVDTAQIQPRSTLTVVDHLKAMPAIDFASAGINQRSVALRGFNDLTTGAVLPLVDNRLMRFPVLSLNAYDFIPLTNDDIERIEIVSGPGSALYGPNSANGIVHIITKSPFGSEGTTVSAGGGERIQSFASFRHAGSWQKRVGYKFSGQYYRGLDWESYDPVEPDSFEIGGKKVHAPRRDFHVEKIGGAARVDLRLTDDLTAIGNAGYSQISGIELTGAGAMQAKKYAFGYLQGRLVYKNIFAQAFFNQIDAGDSYLLRTGTPVVDKSGALAGQIQQSFLFGDGQRFTYGLDILQTFPMTQGTINGRNEGGDNTYENGAFLQSETELSANLNLIAALRVDDHSRMKKRVVSPRAALVYSPNPNHHLRAAYNRGFNTPTTNNLSLDLVSAKIPSLLPSPYPAMLLAREAGVPFATGFTFRRGTDGRPLMMSPLAPAAGYIPATVNSVWPSLRKILLLGAPASQQALLEAALPAQLNTTIPGDLKKFNPAAKDFDPAGEVKDVAPLKPTITNTFELGYKGVLGEKLFFTAEVYHTRVENFISPLSVETPNVFADAQQLAAALQPATATLAQALTTQGATPAQAQAQAQAMINNLVASAAKLPLGVISPNEIANDTEVILTYRNFGNIAFNGMDCSMSYSPNANWKFIGNFSSLHKNFYPRNAQQPHAITLNAPKQKFSVSVQCQDLSKEWEAQLRWRYVGGFPVNTGDYIDWVKRYTALDLDLGYGLFKRTRVFLTVQNAFNRHDREFAGAPMMGRLLMTRIAQSF